MERNISDVYWIFTKILFLVGFVTISFALVMMPSQAVAENKADCNSAKENCLQAPIKAVSVVESKNVVKSLPKAKGAKDNIPLPQPIVSTKAKK